MKCAVFVGKSGKLYYPTKVENTEEWKSFPVVGDKAYQAFYSAEKKTSSNNKEYRVIELKPYKTKAGIDVMVFDPNPEQPKEEQKAPETPDAPF